jgi:competence protein ComEC
MQKSTGLILFSICFAVGILIASVFDISERSVYIGFGLTIFLLGLGYQMLSKSIGIIGLIVLSVSFGAWRMNLSNETSQFSKIENTKQNLEGTIVTDVDKRINTQLLTVKPDGFDQNILITLSKSGDYFYGDRVWVQGKLVAPKSFDNFDYPGYLSMKNVYGLMRYPKVIVIKTDSGNSIVTKLLQFKYYLAQRLARFYSEPALSLLLGILIGARKTLPQEIVDQFTKTGISHIIAISGYNISVIISGLAPLAYLIGRRVSVWVSFVVMLAFVIMAGGSSSIIRACIMGSLVLWMTLLGRPYVLGPAICLSAFLMLLQNPKILYFDVGFQLSFAATIGIVYFVPVFSAMTETKKNYFGFKAIAHTTIAAIIATLPLLLFQFGNLSVIAPLANLAVVPVVPLAMLFGFLSLLPIVGGGFAFITQGLLNYILWVTAKLSRFSWASLPWEISAWQFWVLVVLIFALYFLLKNRVKNSEIELENPSQTW